jgi:hypothetical protein
MDGEGQYKSYWKTNQEEEEKEGRPRLWSMDDVKLDWRNMNVKRWRTGALDRKEWACHEGCHATC